MEEKPEFTLSIGIPASFSYQYALPAVTKSLQQNLFYLSDTNYVGHLIFATDKKPVDKHLEKFKKLLGSKWTIHHLPLDVTDNVKDYKENSALTINILYDAIFCKARELNSDYLLTNEADVILGNDVLEMMMYMINIPNNQYELIISPYNSNGGGTRNAGDFLSLGYGNNQAHIFNDVYPEERKIPEKYKKAKETWESQLKECRGPKDKEKAEKIIKKLRWYDKKIKSFSPIGNVHTLNGIKWRRRGWGSMSAPGAGKPGAYGTTGALFPFVSAYWGGLGANLFKRRCLKYLNFHSHNFLQGTSDLHLIHNELHTNGVRILSLASHPSHHVIKEKTTGKLFIAYAYHEQLDEETRGHLRFRMMPFHNWESGERFIPDK